MLNRYTIDSLNKMKLLNDESYNNSDIIMNVYDNIALYKKCSLDKDLEKFVTVTPKKDFCCDFAKSIEEFKLRLDILTNGQLRHMKWNNEDGSKNVIAGGIINNAFIGNYDCKKSDIDVFVVGDRINDAGFSMSIKQIFDSLHYTKKIYKTDTTINIIGNKGTRPVQIPLKISKSIEHLLLFFDMDCASIAYDGKDLWMTKKHCDSTNTGYNMLSSIQIEKEMFVNRISKYSDIGYGFCVVDTDEPHIVHNINMSYLMPINYPQNIEDISDIFCQDFHIYDDVSKILIGKLINTKWSDKTLLTKENIIRCYMCKRHIKYNINCVCELCNVINNNKKSEYKNLEGHYAIVTGGRVKIGYYTTLKLLRLGATVLVTSRFPNDALTRFANEKDYEEWKDRITVYGLDMRHLESVIKFIDYVEKNIPHLDILINNAAQTVKRPPQFYKHLVKNETHALDENKIKGEFIKKNDKLNMLDFCSTNVFQHNSERIPLSVALTMSHFGDEKDVDESYFPTEKYDNDGQQIDLRKNNSWNSKIDDLSIMEILEVQIINNIAPTMFISKFKKLMVNNNKNSKHIINIQSPEGMFSVEKSSVHPHTNMAKAALNQLTQTIAEEFIKDNIYVNSVDVGWSTSCLPTFIHPPLSYEDSVARIMDPIFSEKYYGKLLKDYRIAEW